MKTSPYLFICLYLLCLACPAISIESSDKNLPLEPLKISTMNSNPPFSMLLPDGTPSGYYVEFWKLWSEVNHIPIIFVPSSFLENIDAVKNHRVDFHSGLFINEERLQWANFSRPFHKIKTGVFFGINDPAVAPLGNLKNARVAVQQGSFQASYLKQNFPNLEIILFTEDQLIINDLLDGKITAVVNEIPYFNTQLGMMGLKGALTLSEETLLINEVSALIPKGNPELVKIINDGINKLPISKLIELEHKWLPENVPFFKNLASPEVPSLTINQQQWLQNNHAYKLGIDQFSPPFEFIENKQFSGISSDYIDIIKTKLDIQMEIKSDASWGELVKLIELGEIDLLPAIVKTPNRNKFMNFSKPYASFPMVIATRKDGFFIQSLDDLEQHQVGILKDHFIEEIIRNNHPAIKIKLFNSAVEALQQLNQGKLDAFVHDLAIITHEINKNNFDDIKIAATTPYKLELSIGVRKGLEELVPIINKTLDTINSKQRAAIANNWLALKINVGTSFTTLIRWFAPIATVLLLIFLFIVRTNRRLLFEITERKKIEHTLELAKNSAEAANKAKDDFLANMSHEIRTPMNAVVGMTHLLEQSNLDKQQQKYVHTLNKSSASLLLLIDDILDLSKIEAGKLNLENVAFDVKELMKDIFSQTQLKMASDKLLLTLDYDDDVPNRLIGDPLRLSQILLNLTNNAVKFTEQGQIKASIKIFHKTQQNIVLHFTISDTGIGISEEHQQRLFQTYSQADSSTTRKYGGTGLGLSICQKLCVLMQGSIWVESRIGFGSSFHFTANFGVHQNDTESNKRNFTNNIEPGNNTANYSSLQGKRILLVDDNQVNLTITTKILSKYGVIVHSVNNGKEAIESLEIALAKNPYDAVLMDVQMPIMDGYTATSFIRKNPQLQAIPIIAMTANVMANDIQKALESGMNGHIAKPLKINEMMDTLSEFIG